MHADNTAKPNKTVKNILSQIYGHFAGTPFIQPRLAICERWPGHAAADPRSPGPLLYPGPFRHFPADGGAPRNKKKKKKKKNNNNNKV